MIALASRFLLSTTLMVCATMLVLLTLLPSRAMAQSGPQDGFAHAWAGLVQDLFTNDGDQYWTVEDGGRIRHKASAASGWVFQDVPNDVQDTLRRVFFMPDNQKGWAVGFNGWVLKTLDGGATWTHLFRMPAVLNQAGKPTWEDLYDIRFIDTGLTGWLVGLHGIWITTNGGSVWNRCTLLMQGSPGAVLFNAAGQDDLLLEKIEFYKLDILPNYFGLAAAEPGLVFRTEDGVTWQVCFDVRCLCTTCQTCYSCSTLPAITGTLGPGPSEDDICEAVGAGFWQPVYEPWDVEISRHATSKLAVLAGGIGHAIGMVFTSTDDGVHWTKERHECVCSLPGGGGPVQCPPPWPCVDEAAYNPNPSNPNFLFRLQSFGTLYGLAILDEDNTVVAGGYAGQHVVRSPSSGGVWEDRSQVTNDILNVPQASTSAFFGATANAGNGSTGKAMVGGAGGFIRQTTNGGQSWTSSVHGSPFRINDVFFKTATEGWQIGQYSRIAKTTDSGVNWTQQLSGADLHSVNLRGVAFYSDNLHGVAVGDVIAGKPRILYTATGGGPPLSWSEIDPSTGITGGGTMAALLDVTWAGNQHFWAAGKAGLMMLSRNYGESWTTFAPAGGQVLTHEFSGVAFSSTTLGLFVGLAAGSPLSQGIVFQYRKTGGTTLWTPVGLPAISGSTITELSDVVISGTKAYAVGEMWTGSVRSGVVLTSTINGSGDFAAFTLVTGGNQPAFAECLVGEDLPSTPVLIEAEMGSTSGADLWVGGQCGRVWRYATAGGGTWTEYQSQTDTHILGISFPAAAGGTVGYFGGERKEFPQQCMVRYQQP